MNPDLELRTKIGQKKLKSGGQAGSRESQTLAAKAKQEALTMDDLIIAPLSSDGTGLTSGVMVLLAILAFFVFWLFTD